MTQITAIEFENFQSIERKTRIEFKPITLLFGPNSAGKSAVFDALELLRVILDPNEFDEACAADMVNRWARWKGDETVRETFLAVEFVYQDRDEADLWTNDENWKSDYPRTTSPTFYIERDFAPGTLLEMPPKFQGGIVRIELRLRAKSSKVITECFLSECKCTINGQPVMSITSSHPHRSDQGQGILTSESDSPDYGERALTVFNALGFMDAGLSLHILRLNELNRQKIWRDDESGGSAAIWVESRSLSPLKVSIGLNNFTHDLENIPSGIHRNGCDILFFLGTLLFESHRGLPGTVSSDRRAPNPKEALTLVDLGLSGWWSRDTFSASSPASLLPTILVGSTGIDEHYRGVAEAAHADLLVRASSDDFWTWSRGRDFKNFETLLAKSKVIKKINYHLEKNLFTEKLYRLSSASVALVPIELKEDDPWGYYSMAQPAVVRIFLKDGNGHNVELQDVGSGIPFVIPILYAIAFGGIAKIQQPELHLHPALQSSIADVFIEELNSNPSSQFIIETHSEHLLLRLLRRIRDLEKKQCLSDEMKLCNDQVAVYYFDPQVSGGTIVTRQLVTPLGDFYADWPRGFFAERNRDLFDD